MVKSIFKSDEESRYNKEKRQKALEDAQRQIARDNTMIKLSSPDLHQLASMRTDKLTPQTEPSRDELGRPKNELIYSFGELKIKAKIDAPYINETTAKLLDLLLTRQRETHEIYTSFRISEVQSLLNVKNRTLFKKKILKIMDTINDITIALTVSSPSKNHVFSSQRYMHMFSSEYNKRGTITFAIDPMFQKSLDENSIPMVIVKTIYKYNGTAYYMFESLLYNYQVNCAKYPDRANKLTIKTLLNNCTNLPKWNDVMTSDRHVKNRIITPIGKAIEELKDEFTISIHLPNGDECKSVDNLPYNDIDDLNRCYLQVDEWKTLDTDKVKELNSKKLKRKNKD